MFDRSFKKGDQMIKKYGVIMMILIVLYPFVMPVAKAATIDLDTYYFGHGSQEGYYQFRDNQGRTWWPLSGDTLDYVSVIYTGSFGNFRIVLDNGTSYPMTLYQSGEYRWERGENTGSFSIYGYKSGSGYGRASASRYRTVESDGDYYRFITGSTLRDLPEHTPTSNPPAPGPAPTPGPTPNPTPTPSPTSNPPPPTTGGDVPSSYWYVDHLDNYRFDYDAPAGAASYKLDFWTAAGDYYSADYNHSPTGIHYLTCNGTYMMRFFDAAGNELGQTGLAAISRINNPTCDSYADGVTGINDLNAGYTPNGDGTYSLYWDHPPGATCNVHQAGGERESEGIGYHTAYGEGGVMIYCMQGGQVVGQADLIIHGQSGGGGENPDEPSCADLICQCIQALMPVLDSINQNTNGTLAGIRDLLSSSQRIEDYLNNLISEVRIVNNSVQQVDQSINRFMDQFITDTNYFPPNPENFNPPSLEDYKPPMIDEPFEDRINYFSDPGDAAAPGPLPVGPDPVKEWKDQNGESVSVEPVLGRDEEMSIDDPLQRDDEMSMDDALLKDPELVQDEKLIRYDDLEMDAIPEPIETGHPLRWNSWEYQR